ncbi:MAG: hypothetical protein ABMA64_12975 [Myxococcota bacterium]
MWWLSAAFAVEPEEVVVIGDPFARWDHTRWSVNAELMLPFGVPLSARDDTVVVSETLQLRTVLGCEHDGDPRKRKIEATCTIEDLGLQVVSVRWSKRPADHERVARVLEQLDARMTGMEVQLQVTADGGVPNVQLEGGTEDARDADDRAADEAVRAVLGQLVSAFQLELPDQGQRLGTFEELHPTLLRIPGLLSAAGSARMVHTVSALSPTTHLVQSIGEGTASLPLPNGRPQFDWACGPEDDMCKAGQAAFPAGDLLDATAQYEQRASSVATVERGILTERVWQVRADGRIVGAGVALPPFVSRGRLRRLGPDDHPDVGPTRQVAPPGGTIDGLGPWGPLEPADQ